MFKLELETVSSCSRAVIDLLELEPYRAELELEPFFPLNKLYFQKSNPYRARVELIEPARIKTTSNEHIRTKDFELLLSWAEPSRTEQSSLNKWAELDSETSLNFYSSSTWAKPRAHSNSSLSSRASSRSIHIIALSKPLCSFCKIFEKTIQPL